MYAFSIVVDSYAPISIQFSQTRGYPPTIEKNETVGAHWSEKRWAVTLISNAKASKGAGLAYIQKRLHIKPEETIAVGDGASDVPMMRYAGVSVAMGNAEPELKNVATFFAPSVSEDGVAAVIRRFIRNS